MKQQPTNADTPLPDSAPGSALGSAVDRVAEASAERRTLLRVAGLTGVVGVVGVGMAACSSSSSPASAAQSPGGAAAGQPSATMAATTAASQPSADATTAGSGAAGTGVELGATSQIPVGGGMIFSTQKVVVTQPVAGTYKAFSSTCTHMGCQVTQITNGLIECPCHGSHYSITDGSVQAGPAPRALPAESITVQGGEIFLSA